MAYYSLLPTEGREWTLARIFWDAAAVLGHAFGSLSAETLVQIKEYRNSEQAYKRVLNKTRALFLLCHIVLYALNSELLQILCNLRSPCYMSPSNML